MIFLGFTLILRNYPTILFNCSENSYTRIDFILYTPMTMMASPIPPVPLKSYIEPTKPVLEVKTEPAIVPSDEPIPEPFLLEDLMELDRLVIAKRLRVRNMLRMRGRRNKFFVMTSDEKLIYTIEEQNRWLVGYLCYGLRPLQLSVANSRGVEVMTIKRPYACTSRVLPCQLQTLEICSPPGRLIGSVQQQWTALKPLYLVFNENDEPLFWVRAPCVTLSFFQDVQFDVQRTDGAHVGSICKRWLGISHALLYATVNDRFGVVFESDLSVQEKALVMAVSLLMDYMYYDS